MKRLLFAAILLAAVFLGACAAPPPAPAPIPTAAVGGDAEVRNLVESFGKRLQMVSLLAPGAAQDMQKQYSEFVSPALLESWMTDVSKAPGRMVSSPWPDRIEITTLRREASGSYVIDGFVIEITSTEIASGGAANRIPVHMVVQRDQGRWLITEYTEEH